MGVNLLGTTRIYGTTDVELFEVSTAVGPVYMWHHANIDHRRILIVDAQKFVRLWRKTTYECHQQVARGSPETWRKDYKYHYSASHFAQGAANPVPLANINFLVLPRGPLAGLLDGNGIGSPLETVNFNDGITRTIWLLSNGADSFPIEVSSGSVDGLRRAAGV